MFLTLCCPGTNLRPRLYIDKVEIKLTTGINYNIYTWTPGRGGTFTIYLNADSNTHYESKETLWGEVEGFIKNKQDQLTIMGLFVCDDHTLNYWKTLEKP